jgi:hypothetical protein
LIALFQRLENSTARGIGATDGCAALLRFEEIAALAVRANYADVHGFVPSGFST